MTIPTCLRTLPALLLLSGGCFADGIDRPLAREIYAELVGINTTDTPAGNCTKAVEAVAKRLRAAGFPEQDIHIVGPKPNKMNLVARLPGTGVRPPLLLVAHTDVVEARREDWSLDPFVLTEKDGYFYGRGSGDDKAMASIFTATMIELKREGYRPDRDIILALTADEEGGESNGMSYLVEQHPELLRKAVVAFNEGGGGEKLDGKRLANKVQSSEKVYQSFRLEVRNKGGHSSRPDPDNAIYHLADGLAKLARYQFPAHLNETTQAYFERMSKIETGATAADMAAVANSTSTSPQAAAIDRLGKLPLYNAMLRTTCVATQLEGGHAENALPQMARAVVNCRILPGEDPQAIQRTIQQVVSDGQIVVTQIAPAKPSQPSPLSREVMQAIAKTSQQVFPGVPVVPTMSTGATDSLYLRNAGISTYGVSGLFGDIRDNRAHGRDERVGVEDYYLADEFLYRLVKEMSTGGGVSPAVGGR